MCYFKNHLSSLFIFIGLTWCLLSLLGCKKDKLPPAPLPKLASIQDCTILPPLPRPYSPPIPAKKTFNNKLLQSAYNLFTALQCTALPETRKYATKYGLGTLLRLPFTTIDSFHIVKHQQQGQWGTVYIQINQDKKAVPFMFHRRRHGRWVLEAIDLQAYLNLSPAEILRYHKINPNYQ